jgi:hypothetical protein
MAALFCAGVAAGTVIDRLVPRRDQVHRGDRARREAPSIRVGDSAPLASVPEAQPEWGGPTEPQTPTADRAGSPERGVSPVELGRLELDLREADTTSVEIEGTGFAERETVSLEADQDGRVAISLMPGAYVIRWMPDESGLHLAHDAVVLPAATTRISLTSRGAGNDATMPADRGRLDVFVLDGYGSALAGAPVLFVGRDITGNKKEALLKCDESGVASLVVRRGTLQVRVGDHIEDVDVNSATNRMTVRCTALGILRLPGLVDADLVVRSVGQREWMPTDYYEIGGRWSGKDAIFVFLNPGRYEVGALGGTRRVGEVRVGPGEEHVLSYAPPTGAIRVEILAELSWDVRERIQAVLEDEDGNKAACWPGHGLYWSWPEEQVGGRSVFHFPNLSPGHYRVSIELSGFEEVRFDADVADGITQIAVPLTRKGR